MRWTGGASVRQAAQGFGMFNVPRPFATLTVEAAAGQRCSYGRKGLRADCPAFPALAQTQRGRRRGVPRTGNRAFKRGVGCAPHEGTRPYYFWCGQARRKVLDALEQAGFLVIRAERRPQLPLGRQSR